MLFSVLSTSCSRGTMGDKEKRHTRHQPEQQEILKSDNWLQDLLKQQQQMFQQQQQLQMQQIERLEQLRLEEKERAEHLRIDMENTRQEEQRKPEMERREEQQRVEQRHIDELKRLDQKREEDRETLFKQQKELAEEARQREKCHRMVEKILKLDANDQLDAYLCRFEERRTGQKRTGQYQTISTIHFFISIRTEISGVFWTEVTSFLLGSGKEYSGRDRGG